MSYRTNFGSGATPTLSSPVSPVASQPDMGSGSANQTTSSGGLLGGLGGLLNCVLNLLGLEKLKIGALEGWGGEMHATKRAMKLAHRAGHRDGASDTTHTTLPDAATTPHHTHRHAAFRRLLKHRSR